MIPILVEYINLFGKLPLISFKRDKNRGALLVRSAFQTSYQPGTFKFTHARYKTDMFFHSQV